MSKVDTDLLKVLLHPLLLAEVEAVQQADTEVEDPEDEHLGDVDQLYQLVYNIQESIGAKLRDKDGADQAQIPQFNFGFEPSTCLMINNMWTLERFLEETKDQDLDKFDRKMAT